MLFSPQICHGKEKTSCMVSADCFYEKTLFKKNITCYNTLHLIYQSPGFPGIYPIYYIY